LSFLEASGQRNEDGHLFTITLKETDPVVFFYNHRYLSTGRLFNSKSPFKRVKRFVKTGRVRAKLAPLMEILREAEFFDLYPPFYDKVVKQLSLHDYKDVVESLGAAGEDSEALSIQHSLATAFVEYSHLPWHFIICI
jgi:hypothetical protein